MFVSCSSISHTTLVKKLTNNQYLSTYVQTLATCSVVENSSPDHVMTCHDMQPGICPLFRRRRLLTTMFFWGSVISVFIVAVSADRSQHDINWIVTDNSTFQSSLRVAGGREVPRGKYPYTVGMRKTINGTSFCGGTLVSPKFIITAAHCARKIKYVAIGTHFRQGTVDGMYWAPLRIISHPLFGKAPYFAHDLAIVELEEEIEHAEEWMAYLGENEPPVGQFATLHGWGRVSYQGNGSEVLKEVDLPIVSAETCEAQLGSPRVSIHDSMLCAGGELDHAACSGDSGGPLVLNKDSRHPVLIGAVSWGKRCGAGAPEAYARISYFKDFIDQHITGHTWVTV